MEKIVSCIQWVIYVDVILLSFGKAIKALNNTQKTSNM